MASIKGAAGGTMIRDLTRGSVARQLFSFAMPLFVSNALQALYNLVDMVIVGQYIGPAGMSAVSIGGDILHLITFVAMGFSSAGQGIIARAVGAGRRDEIPKTIGTMFSFLMAAAALIALFCFALRENILTWLNTPKASRAYAMDYMVTCAAGLLLIYGYAYYFVSKIKNPSLRYFPVFEFLLPILAGMTIQVMVYGISLIPISFVIAFAGIVIALQNECIYIDKLTGVYNRYELDKVLGSLKRKRHEKIAAMMLDLNGFKEINDKYSHEEGDQALIAFAGILVAIVRGRGTVIRFAGDEFVVLMRKVDGVDIEACRNQILHAVDDYNAGSGKPYKLSAAVGGTIFDYNGQNANEIVERIDRLMYKDKDEYYRNHPRHR